MLKRPVICFEHDDLLPDTPLEAITERAITKKATAERAITDRQIMAGQCHIPPALFNELFDQVLEQPQVWLSRAWRGRQPVLRTAQYVGVVQGRCGYHLEILPKTGKSGQSAEQLRLMLLRLLQALPDSPFKLIRQQALVQLAQLPLIDICIQRALYSILQVVQRGLKRQYRSRQDNLPVLRGRLHIQQHILHNHSNRARFYTQSAEYETDCAENRILRLALDCLGRLNMSAANQQLLQCCLPRMAGIQASLQPAQDFKAVRLDRNSQYYASALQWAALIIQGVSPAVNSGQQPAFSMLFDMNKLFENIVAQGIKQQLPAGWQLHSQQQTAALLKLHQRPQQQLQPDLLLFNQHQPAAVLDSKWKIKTGNTFKQLKPDEQELYQMFAYAAAYLPQGGEVCLIYPKTAQFDTAVGPLVFQHIRDAQVNLWLLPFCLEHFKLVNAPFHWSAAQDGNK